MISPYCKNQSIPRQASNSSQRHFISSIMALKGKQGASLLLLFFYFQISVFSVSLATQSSGFAEFTRTWWNEKENQVPNEKNF